MGLSRAADHSRLWVVTATAVAAVGGGRVRRFRSAAIAGAVALLGGPWGRRAAAEAVASIGLASAVSNLALKSVTRRHRPDAGHGQVLPSRQVRRPTSPSFPSGHAASAFAFASTTGEDVPVTWVPLHVAASLVAYARVHTGVHYPSDVVVGAMCGWTVRRLAGRLAPRAQSAGPGHVASG